MAGHGALEQTELFGEGQPDVDDPPAVRTATCVAHVGPDRVCGKPARFINMKLGGYVCDEHREKGGAK